MVGGGCLVLVLPFIFLAILLVIGIAFFGDPQSRNQPSQVEEETNEQKRATPKIKTAATARGVEVGVGETAELRDRTLVVDEVERNYPPPRRASKLKADEEFLRVFVTLTNTSNESFKFNLGRFEVQDSNGVQRTPESIQDLPYPLRVGSLAPDRTLKGNMVFPVPQGDSGLSLVYEPFEGEDTVTVRPL